MKEAKFVCDITITDPDTNNDVEITIFKHENGGMFGIDASYIESVLEEDDEKISDPLGKGIVKLNWD